MQTIESKSKNRTMASQTLGLIYHFGGNAHATRSIPTRNWNGKHVGAHTQCGPFTIFHIIANRNSILHFHLHNIYFVDSSASFDMCVSFFSRAHVVNFLCDRKEKKIIIEFLSFPYFWCFRFEWRVREHRFCFYFFFFAISHWYGISVSALNKAQNGIF